MKSFFTLVVGLIILFSTGANSMEEFRKVTILGREYSVPANYTELAKIEKQGDRGGVILNLYEKGKYNPESPNDNVEAMLRYKVITIGATPVTPDDEFRKLQKEWELSHIEFSTGITEGFKASKPTGPHGKITAYGTSIATGAIKDGANAPLSILTAAFLFEDRLVLISLASPSPSGKYPQLFTKASETYGKLTAEFFKDHSN